MWTLVSYTCFAGPTYVLFVSNQIDTSHKSKNALDKYPWIHHFVTEMCTHVHIYVTNRCILWDMGLVHCRISVMGLLCLQVPWHKDHHQETCWFSSCLLHLTFVFKKSLHNLHHKYSCCWSHPWLMIVLITKIKKRFYFYDYIHVVKRLSKMKNQWLSADCGKSIAKTLELPQSWDKTWNLLYIKICMPFGIWKGTCGTFCAEEA